MNAVTISNFFSAVLKTDPRHYQIAVLSSFVLLGTVILKFGIDPINALAILLVALSTQWVFTRYYKLPLYDPRSPLISALSLCLLLRTDLIWIAALAAFVAIASKFWIRYRQRHVFNPANFAIIVAMVVTPHAWVSSGQWGSALTISFFIGCLGLVVVNRAKRADVTFAFLFAYVGFILLRAWWLGDPLAIAWHQLQSGALLVFAFFMISDPKTTPDTALSRVIYGVLVAAFALTLQFGWHVNDSVIWSLVLLSPTVPIFRYFFNQKNIKHKVLIKTTFLGGHDVKKI